jgi:hypothetical protein
MNEWTMMNRKMEDTAVVRRVGSEHDQGLRRRRRGGLAAAIFSTTAVG